MAGQPKNDRAGAAWPPLVGEYLPRPADAHGIRKKLTTYSLQGAHEGGAPKARGFERILGITLSDVDYLVGARRTGISSTPITDVRDNGPFGTICEVRIRVRGLRTRRNRVVLVTTAWELRSADAPPRLVTAYIKD